ncbi:MAG: GspE/PulE family protein [Phycisphaerales bacterium JB039]
MLSYDDFVLGAITEERLLDEQQLELARAHAVEQSVSVIDALLELHLLSSQQLSIIRALVYETPYANLDHYDIDLRNTALLPRSVAERARAFPLFHVGSVVTVGMADPLDLRALDAIRSATKLDIEPVLCDPVALEGLIERAYSLSAGGAVAAQDDAPAFDTSDERPIVAAVNQIISLAVEQGASDIHLGPDERELHLRFRIDGMLQMRQGPPRSAHPALVQRLKVMAGLDLTQTRRPQDGKFRFRHEGRSVDVRLSVIPTVAGENVVMRLLSGATSIRSFEDLGFSQELIEQFQVMVEQPHGMILVTGPTGSGKTTTLYTALATLNTPERNIITIEDPVEIRLPLLRQVQVNSAIGLTFATALRSVLRQDPDVVLVGEIRDDETARIAVQAALTGHLVLATLHTNDACGAVARLHDLGAPPFAINSSVLCAMAQRLVRRVCAQCAAPDSPEPSLLRRFDIRLEDGQFQVGAGCSQCANLGVRGRLVVAEMLRMTGPVKEAIERQDPAAELRRIALREGMRPMWLDGLDKARRGLTTLAEVGRVVAGAADDDERPGAVRAAA